MPPAPTILPENAGVAFRGEPAWPPAALTPELATQLVQAPNRCGRPNTDVLRRRISVVDGEPREAWQIDFPGHFTLQEAALYEEPFDFLQRNAPDWKNPHANPALRRALARLTRFLAMPVDADAPDWIWIEDDLIPDASLVAVARDDDFTHGVLSSGIFAAWYRLHHSALAPDDVVGSFPFPWPPTKGLGDLTAAQQESRHAVARAIRAGNPDSVQGAVCRAYGWPEELADADIGGRLETLCRQRTG